MFVRIALLLFVAVLAPAFLCGQVSEKENASLRPGAKAKATLPSTLSVLITHPSVIEVNAKLYKQLEQNAKVDFFEVRFADVIDELKAVFRVPIIIDDSAVENGLDEDTLITLTVQGVPFRTALKLMVHDFNCTYQLRDEVVYIMDKEMAYSKFETRIFDCRDLLRHLGYDEKNIEKLIDAVRSSVEPYSWDVNGGKGSIKEIGGLLIVLQRSTHQIAVQQLLDELNSRLITSSGKEK